MAEQHHLRAVRIGIVAVLMMATVFVIGRSFRSASTGATLPLGAAGAAPAIPVETGVFRLARSAGDYARAPAEGTRTMSSFVERRAYPGGPPIIPHPLADATSFGGRTCLACHGDGGWVDKWQAYAPVTPHPSLINCVQCHVADSGAPVFRGSTFTRPSAPPIGQTALPGSPPAIPHDLQLRENCLACHAGPGAVRELRVTHPERSNCRQCHALGAARVEPFVRAPGGER
jgi:cytochrome c-type protein NapB